MVLRALPVVSARPGPERRVEAEPRRQLSPTGARPLDPLAPGQVLGDRYRIRSLLGRGGMGEVFRAFDLKLRVDVALKAVRLALLADERALDGLRQEVRAAREVVSPNVCRVFDLVELDGRELVSMEFVDGVTLADVLREKKPARSPGGPGDRRRSSWPGSRPSTPPGSCTATSSRRT